jgi:CDP-diacylglycerol--glycerol-3-phosphate 3-phosphatidyltransferase
LTYTGFVLTALTAVLLARGNFVWGALMLTVASLFDMLDGSLARATKQSSKFGAFIDSTLDRYSESITFLALAFFYSRTPATRTELVLIVVILIGSLMVSYTRARAEALQIECKVGILQRPERIVLLIAGLLTGWMAPVLWVMAVLTNFSAFQRIYEVYVQTNEAAPAVPPVPNPKAPKVSKVSGETPPVQQ